MCIMSYIAEAERSLKLACKHCIVCETS